MNPMDSHNTPLFQWSFKEATGPNFGQTQIENIKLVVKNVCVSIYIHNYSYDYHEYHDNNSNSSNITSSKNNIIIKIYTSNVPSHLIFHLKYPDVYPICRLPPQRRCEALWRHGQVLREKQLVISKKSTNYKVVPPVISWFIIPLTIDISPINHSYWSCKPT